MLAPRLLSISIALLLCACTVGSGSQGSTDDPVDDPVDDDPSEVESLAASGAQPLVGPFSPALAIGGGPGFAGACTECRFYRAEDAFKVVRTASELDEALQLVASSTNKLIYVADDAEIDLAGQVWPLPSGTILASGRGRNGSKGGLLYFSRPQGAPRLDAPGGGVRITGLRVRGPDPTGALWWVADRETTYQHDVIGIRVLGTDNVIENNQIFGWTVAAISVEGGSARIQYNHIHHNMLGSLGYGVQTKGGAEPLVQYNYFNNNRHSLATNGVSGYIARYNYFGSRSLLHVLDSHESDDNLPNRAGSRLIVHHNTFASARNPHTNGRPPGVKLRGITVDTTKIHNNWFRGFVPPTQPNVGPGAAVVQTRNASSTFERVAIWDNTYDTNAPASPDVGLPR